MRTCERQVPKGGRSLQRRSLLGGRARGFSFDVRLHTSRSYRYEISEAALLLLAAIHAALSLLLRGEGFRWQVRDA